MAQGEFGAPSPTVTRGKIVARRRSIAVQAAYRSGHHELICSFRVKTQVEATKRVVMLRMQPNLETVKWIKPLPLGGRLALGSAFPVRSKRFLAVAERNLKARLDRLRKLSWSMSVI